MWFSRTLRGDVAKRRSHIWRTGSRSSSEANTNWVATSGCQSIPEQCIWNQITDETQSHNRRFSTGCNVVILTLSNLKGLAGLKRFSKLMLPPKCWWFESSAKKPPSALFSCCVIVHRETLVSKFNLITNLTVMERVSGDWWKLRAVWQKSGRRNAPWCAKILLLNFDQDAHLFSFTVRKSQDFTKQMMTN